MTIADALPVLWHVFAVGGSTLFIYCVWQAFKPRPKQEDKVYYLSAHEVRELRYHEYFGEHPSDYRTGWLWECTCGVGNKSRILFMPKTAEEAVEDFLSHKRFYENLGIDL